MGYNITRRILRAQKTEFVQKFKEMNKLSNKAVASLLGLKKEKMTLHNQYELFIDMQIHQIEKNYKNQKEVIGFGEEKVNG